MSERQRKAKKLAEKAKQSAEKTEEKRKKREREFVHPSRLSASEGAAASSGGVADVQKKGDASESKSSDALDVERLVHKFAKAGKKRKSSSTVENRDDAASDVVPGLSFSSSVGGNVEKEIEKEKEKKTEKKAKKEKKRPKTE